MKQILKLAILLPGLLLAQTPTITDAGSDSLTTTSVRFFGNTGLYHDVASDVTLTDGFTSSGEHTIHVSSTANWVGYDLGGTGSPGWPTSFIMNGNEWGRVRYVVDGTHAVVQMTDPGGFGGGDRTEDLFRTFDGMSISCTAGICTVTTPYATPYWWVTGHPIRINYSAVTNLDNNNWAVLVRTDGTHFTFDTGMTVANGIYNSTNSPDMWLQSGFGTVHSPGETLSLIGTDFILCYGDPGGGSGTYGNSNNTEAGTSFFHAAQAEKHWSYLTNQTPGAVIHYVLMATPRQLGSSNCTTPAAHTAVTPDATVTFPGSESTTPAPPVGVTFSTALPGSYTDSMTVGIDPNCLTLQACIDYTRSHSGNHEILITAGTTITAPSTGWILRAQTGGSLITTIRTSAADNTLPAPGACVPPLTTATNTPATSPCIDNPTYASHLATLQTGNSTSATPVFIVSPTTAASSFHIGPGLKIQANPDYALEVHSSLIDLSHTLGDGVWLHSAHASNVVVDRVYFYQLNVGNGAYNSVHFQGGTSNAMVDCVAENIASRTQDIGGGVELDGIDTSDGGYIISNNRMMAQMPIFLGNDGWNTADVLIFRNWLHNSDSWNRQGIEWISQVNLPVASATAGATTVVTLGKPSEYGITGFTSLNSEPLNFRGATGNWTPLNAHDFQLLDSTLSDFNCDGSHCIATTGSAHGLTTGDYAWVGGLSGIPCFNEVGGHQITVTNSTHFQYSSSTNSHCRYSQVFVTAPVFFVSLGQATNLTLALNSSGFGALTGTVTAHYGGVINAKNTGEFKTGVRAEISGNRFERGITDQQNATGFALTNRVLGFDPHQFSFNATISDVYFHDNWLLNVGKLLAYLGVQDNGGNIPSARITYSNNLGTDSNCLMLTPGENCFAEGIQFSLGTHVYYDHMTFMSAQNASGAGASPLPPSFGDVSVINSIFTFSGQGFGANGGQNYGAQLLMTSGSCTSGPCFIANPPFPNAETNLRNVLVGDTSAGGDDFGFQRRYYDGYSSGKYNTGNQADSAEYQNTFWPHNYGQVGFAGLTAISNATNADPIVLTTASMSCIPAAGDRIRVTGVLGNLAANGIVVVKSATITTITLLTPGGDTAGAYSSGGTVMPLTGACNVISNWALGSSSNYKAGTPYVGAIDYLINPDSTGTGDALDGADIGVDTAAISAAIAGCALNPSALPNATVTEVYSQTIVAVGCTPSLTYSITSGTLSGSGLSLNTSTGAVTGTVTGPATYSFTVGYDTASTPYTIVVSAVPSITTSSLPAGTQGVGYSQTIGTTAGTGTVTCAITSGSLSGSGLTLASNCGITGTAATPAVYSFTVAPTDSVGIVGSGQPLTLTVNAASGAASAGTVVIGNAPVVGPSPR